MKDFMFLLEVRRYGDGSQFKRRISESDYGLEDWLGNNAHKWADGEVLIDCNNYCRGTIYYNNKPLYVFEAHNIAVV